jgi:hypothetical protein
MIGTIRSMSETDTPPAWAIASGRPATSTHEFQLARFAAELEVATRNLESEIRSAHESGMSDRAIAVAAGISHPKVARILRAS